MIKEQPTGYSIISHGGIGDEHGVDEISVAHVIN